MTLEGTYIDFFGENSDSITISLVAHGSSTYPVTEDVLNDFYIITGNDTQIHINQKNKDEVEAPIYLNDQQCIIDGVVHENKKCFVASQVFATQDLQQLKKYVSTFTKYATVGIGTSYYAALLYHTPYTVIPYMALVAAEHYNVQQLFVGENCQDYLGDICEELGWGFFIIKNALFASTVYNFNGAAFKYISTYKGGAKLSLDFVSTIINGIMLTPGAIDTAVSIPIEILINNDASGISKIGYQDFALDSVEEVTSILTKPLLTYPIFYKFVAKNIKYATQDLIGFFTSNDAKITTNHFNNTISSKPIIKTLPTAICQKGFLSDFKTDPVQSQLLVYCLQGVRIVTNNHLETCRIAAGAVTGMAINKIINIYILKELAMLEFSVLAYGLAYAPCSYYFK